MATIAETLRATGFTDEQISALDPKLITVFTTIQTSAEQAKAEADRKEAEAKTKAEKAAADLAAWEKTKADAELLQRSNSQFYEESIVPGLVSWKEERDRLLTEKTNAEALAAFLKAQNEGARANGFIPADAPAFTAPVNPNPANGTRDAQGKFVPNAPGSTPGSPTFTMEQVRDGLGNTLGTISDVQWRYQSLFGKPMPISPTELVRQSEANKFKDPATYASQIFKFSEREEEMRREAAKKHDDDIAAVASAAKDAEWKAKLDEREKEFAAKEKLIAERTATGSPVSVATSAKFPEIQRKVVSKEMPDPLLMNDSQRRANTAKMIRDQIAERENVA